MLITVRFHLVTVGIACLVVATCVCAGAVPLTPLAFGLVSDLICCLFSVLVFVWDGEGGTVHASADWPPPPHDVCDCVQPPCDMFIHFLGHITHRLFLSI